MKVTARERAWDDLLKNPWEGRQNKPRISGLTMVIDTGLGLEETRDLLALSSAYIDFFKFGFGTAKLYPADLLRRKVALLKEYKIHVYPGGTFLEVAIVQNKWREFLQRALEIGFDSIEVSDGTISYDSSLRRQIIQYARSLGLIVCCEVGKKMDASPLPTEQLYNFICRDLESGAFKVIIEGRESGMGVGIYKEDGSLRKREIEQLQKKLEDVDAIMWEAPLKTQQEALIRMFGNNVNIGNIPPHNVLSLEALRCGLRGDTLCYTVRSACRREIWI